MDSDSDAEYQAYNGRLKEASAARTRLRKVRTCTLIPNFLRFYKLTHGMMAQAKQTRDKNRTALATAYESSLKQIQTRIRKSVAKHNDLRYDSPPLPPYPSTSHPKPYPLPASPTTSTPPFTLNHLPPSPQPN